MGAKEFFTTTGENLLKKVKELIDEGNVRRITITEKSGRELMSFPPAKRAKPTALAYQ